MTSSTGKLWLKRIAITLGILIFLLIVTIFGAVYWINSDSGRGYISNQASAKSGRNFALDGIHFRHAWSRQPRIVLDGLKIGNADWAKNDQMFKAERIEIVIEPLQLLRGRLVLPEIIVVSPKLALEKNMEGKGNWQFGENPPSEALEVAAPENRFEFPIIGHLDIQDGEMNYVDPKRKIDTTLSISTANGGKSGEQMLKLEGKGDFEKENFQLNVSAASLLQLRETETPYPFNIHTVIGDTVIDVKGTVKDPVKMEALEVTLDIKGANAADLFLITGIALPPTPNYRVRGHLTHGSAEESWVFKDFKGNLGSSDLSGDLEWHAEKEKQPYLKANFVSENLDIKDMAGFVGADKKPADTSRVIPDQAIDISRLTAMDADVTFKGKRIKTTSLIDDFNMVLKLRRGTLSMTPVSFGMADGEISANIVIEGQAKPPTASADVAFKRLSLAKLFDTLAAKFGKENVSAGLLGGKAKLKGTGKSLREILGSSNGEIGLGMEGGKLSRLLLELAGIDIYKSLGFYTGGDEPVTINCVVGDFGVQNGVMTTRVMLVDTDVTTLEGQGSINLRTEDLGMRLLAHPKDSSLFSVRTPILINGTMKKPAIGLDPVALAARGGAAAVLGALLTPIGALLAFIEPGLGEESNCAQFVKKLDVKTGGAIPDNTAGKK